MLAAAYFAAAHLNCRWAFDCEDVLSEEVGEGVDDPAHRELVQYVERTFLPAAAYVTTASPEFGPWLTDRYGVIEPTYVANVPSLAEAPEGVRAGYPDARRHLSLYWFSISIGPLRGVEDAVRALPHLGVPARLHLRGRMLPGFDRELRALVDSLGVQDRVFVHDLAAPGDVVRAAADHDIGLVLMQPCCDNHEMAVPNKLYAYMMAGLAVGSTTTRGLTGVVAGMGDIGFQYAPGNHLQLAARINDLAADPRRLHAARAEAFRLAQTRYNWEREQQRLVNVVDRLPRHSPAAPVLNPAET
jgi:glycosyltransferase involved in cell wall biosynthesis